MGNNTKIQKFASEFERIVKDNPLQNIQKLKMRLSLEHNLKKIPTNIELLAYSKDYEFMKKIIQTKPMRTESGVTVCALMTYPIPCPHGKCTYCPGGVGSVFGDVPQSYTGNEPASKRGKRNLYDPYLQIFNRLEQYISLGHSITKIEAIFMGGTFPSFPETYQLKFTYYFFKALNDFSKIFFTKENKIIISEFRKFFIMPGSIEDNSRVAKIKIRASVLKKINLDKTSNKNIPKLLDLLYDFSENYFSEHKTLTINNISEMTETFFEWLGENTIKKELSLLTKPNYEMLADEQKKNQISNSRCVGLTIETRPDYGYKEHGIRLLKLGATRVELGIQSLDNNVLEKINRGHDINASIKSIYELKELGFKLNFHIMLGLPLTSPKDDIRTINELFENQNFRPDMIKIYPLVIMRGTKIYDDWKQGKYKPIDPDTAVSIISETYPKIPKYCRVMRIQRDIPSTIASASNVRTNLRQMVDKKIAELVSHGKKIWEIRYREYRGEKIEQTQIFVEKYKASKSDEYFISFEDDKRKYILGFCRLRFAKGNLTEHITGKTAIIRELHVYGKAAELGSTEKQSAQHKGAGKKMIEKAEEIAKQNGKEKIAIISGIGVREYYRKLGYELEGPYMVKYITR